MAKFSELLDVQAYDPQTQTFICNSNYLGYVWCCEPLSFVNQDLENQLKALVHLDFPLNSYLSFSLIANDDLLAYYQRYQQLRYASKDNPVLQEETENRLKFLQQLQAHGAGEEAPCRLRNYLLVVSLKCAYQGRLHESLLNDYQQYSAQLEASLQLIFSSCQRLDQRDYLYLLRNLLLDKDVEGLAQQDPKFTAYNPELTLAQQVLVPSSEIRLYRNCLACDQRLVQVFTPLEIPQSFSCGQGVSYLGDLLSGVTPLTDKFMLTCNLALGNPLAHKSKFDTKRAWTIRQTMGPLARFLPKLAQTVASFDNMAADLEQGDRLLKLSWTLVTWIPDDGKHYQQVTHGRLPQAQAFAVKVKSYFQTLGWALDYESSIALPCLLNALPLEVDASSQTFLARYRSMSTSQAVVCLPVFAEWKASPSPVIPLVSRTGQLMSLDLFASQTNFNCCIAAQSGSGKSFLVNEMVANLLATGAQCWIIDIGRSYKKLAEVYHGEFLEFSLDAQININPFHLIHDYSQDADMLFTLIQTMLSPKDLLSEYQANAIKQILKEQWQLHGKYMSIDQLAETLATAEDSRISDLAVHLFPYTSKGAYGEYFTAVETNMVSLLYDLEQQQLQQHKSRLIVLELEELSGRKDLQQLVLLQLIFAINQQMTQGDRQRQKVLFIDEAWDLLASKTISYFIETGYRRFRKYNGSVVTITQSLEDLYNSPSGRAIAANSASYLFLSQKTETVKQLLSDHKLILDSAAINQITSLRTRKGKYSEIFCYSEQGYGVGRLIVSPAHQLLYSTDAKDIVAIQQVQAEQKLGIWQAIHYLLEQRKQASGNQSVSSPYVAEENHGLRETYN